MNDFFITREPIVPQCEDEPPCPEIRGAYCNVYLFPKDIWDIGICSVKAGVIPENDKWNDLGGDG